MGKEMVLLIAKVLIALLLVGAVVVMALQGIPVPETLKLMAMAAVGYLYHQRSSGKQGGKVVNNTTQNTDNV